MTAILHRDSAVRTLRSPRMDENGFLHVDAELARVGVLDYPDRVAHGEPRRRLVPPEALFDPRSMASLVGMPVTDLHPSKMIGPDEARQHQKGSVSGMPWRDGQFLIAPLTITDSALIAKVMARQQVEMSPGYMAELLVEPGVWQHAEWAPAGEAYDAVQGPRIYNHAAVVPVGRCAGDCGGEACRCAIHLDAKGKPMTPKKIKITHKDGSVVEMPFSMLQELIGGMDPAKAIEYLLGMVSASGGEDPAAPEPEVQPVPAPAMEGAPRPPQMDRRPANTPALDAHASLLARVAAQDAQLQAMRDQLAAHGVQSARALAQGEVASFVGRWTPFMDGFAGATVPLAQKHLLKRLYPEQVATIDAYPDPVLSARCDLAELDPMVRAVRANAANGGLAALGLLAHGDAAEVDPLAASDARLNGRAYTAPKAS